MWRFNTQTQKWTWVWGSNKVNAAMSCTTVQGPPGLAYHSSTYDPVGRKLYVIGGATDLYFQSTTDQGLLSDFWAYDVAQNTWLQLAGVCYPSMTSVNLYHFRSASIVWRASTKTFLNFGGFGDAYTEPPSGAVSYGSLGLPDMFFQYDPSKPGTLATAIQYYSTYALVRRCYFRHFDFFLTL